MLAIYNVDEPMASSSAKDSNPSQPPASTYVVAGIHKEALQATGGPTSLGVTSEEKSNPQLIRDDALVDPTTEVDPEKFAHNDSVSQQQDKTKSARDGLKAAHTITRTDKDTNNAKKEDLSKLVKYVDVDFMDLDSPADDGPIMLEKEKENDQAEVAFLLAQPSYPDVEQLTKLLVTSLKPELIKLLTDHDFSASLPKEIKELPTKFCEICGEIKDLKKCIIERNKLKLEVPTGLLALQGQVTEALNMFATSIAPASQTTGVTSVPLVGQAGTYPAEGEENIKQAIIT
ncbi:hypothetical protein Tco_1368553 [Tanacetum coccineum]